MTLDRKLLELAKMGLEKPKEAREAAQTILVAAWENSRPKSMGELRHRMDDVAEQLKEIAASKKNGVVLHGSLDRAQKNHWDGMQELFQVAWDVAHKAGPGITLDRLFGELDILFYTANASSEEGDQGSYPAEPPAGDVPAM